MRVKNRISRLNKFVVISGCSGGGKSTILAKLERRGYAVVGEPGRRIVLEEIENEGKALPWSNPKAFARRAIEMALADRNNAKVISDWVFFDRGLVDACAALEHLTRFRGQSLTAGSVTDSRLAFGGSLGRADWRYR